MATSSFQSMFGLCFGRLTKQKDGMFRHVTSMSGLCPGSGGKKEGRGEGRRKRRKRGKRKEKSHLKYEEGGGA